MQTLHPFVGSVQQYTEQLANPDCYRPGYCPQCHTKHPLTAHGFYTRTLSTPTTMASSGVRRYLCQACQRTVSLLPEFILPYLRSSLTLIALFLIARLFRGQTLQSAVASAPSPMLGSSLPRAGRSAVRHAGRVDPTRARADFNHRALAMLESTGWIAAHRFLFAGVR